MATYTYKHAVKVNGKIIPPGTEINIEDEKKTVKAESIKPAETGAKRKK